MTGLTTLTILDYVLLTVLFFGVNVATVYVALRHLKSKLGQSPIVSQLLGGGS